MQIYIVLNGEIGKTPHRQTFKETEPNLALSTFNNEVRRLEKEGWHITKTVQPLDMIAVATKLTNTEPRIVALLERDENDLKKTGRFQLLTARYLGGKLERQELDGKAVEHPTAFQAEWTGRNIYAQGGCREWRVLNAETGETVARYPESERGTGVNILAVFRASLNTAGHDWEECVRIVDAIAPLLEEASWVETDTGRTFDLSFVPKEN